MHHLLHRVATLLLSPTHERLVRTLAYTTAPPPHLSGERDYIRGAALALAARRIDALGVQGAIAEVGVYRGAFARILSHTFPDRQLLLFDTFEGFPEDERQVDLQHGHSDAAHDFSHTSPELVVNRLPYPARAIPVVGKFSSTANGHSDKAFALASLDVDLYESTRSALDFFYPRLSPGGYIFVHDYDNLEYRGVKRAVEDFLLREEVGAVPLPDTGGSIVLSKPMLAARPSSATLSS